MGNRLSKIYTRTGDQGTTGLGDGSRIQKSSLRVEAMGDVDELNSILGLLLCEELDDDIVRPLQEVQHVLFNVGGELSIPGSCLVQKSYTTRLEGLIDGFNQDLPALKEFILPGGNRAAAVCHMARAVCRRAERKVVELAEHESSINKESPVYLNRLSDLLFVLGRVLARRDGKSEVYWQKDLLP